MRRRILASTVKFLMAALRVIQVLVEPRQRFRHEFLHLRGSEADQRSLYLLQSVGRLASLFP